MATEHEHWRECSDIYALGALDGEELKNFQAHLATDCPTCEAYVRYRGETLNLLHRSLRPMTPPPAVKARILHQIDNDAAVSIATNASATPASLAPNGGGHRRGNSGCRCRRRLLPFSLRAAPHGLQRRRQSVARSVNPRSTALRRRADAAGQRALSLERIGRRPHLRDRSSWLPRQAKCTPSGRSPKAQRRATSARSKLMQQAKAACTSTQTQRASRRNLCRHPGTRRHDRRTHGSDGARIQTVLAAVGFEGVAASPVAKSRSALYPFAISPSLALVLTRAQSSRALWLINHLPMWNSCFLENRPDSTEI